MLHAAYLIIAFPLLGSLLLMTFGRRLGEPVAGWLGTAAITASFVVAVVVFFGVLHAHQTDCIPGLLCQGSPIAPGSLLNDQFVQHLFNWVNVGGFHANVDLLVDPLSITMCLFITGISAMIHLYSIAYMHGEEDFTKFFIYLNLFVTSMLILVLGGNLLLTFIGWEGVGVCSYWLVSYYFQKDSAASAGKKAFIYNRVGDVGFLLAIFILYSQLHTVSYVEIFQRAGHLSPLWATMAVLALVLAASGKSAQIPLFNWLPDAMEGPTPVSALIHAATMVTAGVYLLCRLHGVVNLSSTGQGVICGVGLATAFVAATVATSQSDIKKGLAFSTVSQIGFMVLAVGTKNYEAAIFLMVAHAFFKALLFLGSGSVIHALDGEQEMVRMGGLRKVLPWTFGTFMIGWLAIAGVPPFAGFFAKGSVLDGVFAKSPVLWALALLTALLTAYYMSRLFYLTFTGEERFTAVGPNGEPGIEHPHESPWHMRFPLVVLAILSAAGGAIDLPWVHTWGLDTFLNPVFLTTTPAATNSGSTQLFLAIADAVVAVAGIGLAWVLWRGKAARPELTPAFLKRVWFWDDAYDAVIGRPATALSKAAAIVDDEVIDGAVLGTATLVRRGADQLRKAQDGYVRTYALSIAAGMAAFLIYLVTRVFS